MADYETREGHRMTAVSYMSAHQHDPNANNLWQYFQTVLNWAMNNFDMKKFKKIMKGIDWALYYDKYHTETLNTVAMGKRISGLISSLWRVTISPEPTAIAVTASVTVNSLVYSSPISIISS